MMRFRMRLPYLIVCECVCNAADNIGGFAFIHTNAVLNDFPLCDYDPVVGTAGASGFNFHFPR